MIIDSRFIEGPAGTRGEGKGVEENYRREKWPTRSDLSWPPIEPAVRSASFVFIPKGAQNWKVDGKTDLDRLGSILEKPVVGFFQAVAQVGR